MMYKREIAVYTKLFWKNKLWMRKKLLDKE